MIPPGLQTRKGWGVLFLVLLVLFITFRIHQTEKNIRDVLNRDLAPTDTSAGFALKQADIRFFSSELLLSELAWFPNRHEHPVVSDQVRIRTTFRQMLLIGLVPSSWIPRYVKNLNIMASGVVWSGFRFDAAITLTHDADAPPYFLKAYSTTFDMTPAAGSPALPAAPHIGHIAFSRAQFTIAGFPGTDSLSLAPEWFLTHPVSASLDLQSPVFYPADDVLPDFRNMLTLFGIPPDAYAFRSLQAAWSANEDSWIVEYLRLVSPHFTVNFTGTLHPRLPDPVAAGTVRLSDMSEPVRNFMENMERLSNRSLPRDGSDILLPVNGPLRDIRLF